MSGPAPPDVLVGRVLLLDQMRVWAGDALGGRGRCMLLTGEPGIGKTRTAQEILEHARGREAVVASGRCHPDPGAPPYWPWIQVLRALSRRTGAGAMRRALGPDVTSVVEILPELRADGDDLGPPPALEAAAARFRLLDALVRLCLDAAHRHPLALLLDDLQWADAGSLRVLELLAPAARDVPLLILATCRSARPGSPGPADELAGRLGRLADVLPLAGIEPADVARLIELTAGSPAPAAAVAAVHRRTAGNPLFVRELLRLLAGTHDLARLSAAEVEAAPLPSTIRHVIGERLRLLRSAARAALETAALAGKEFDVETLRAVAASADIGLPPPAELLDALAGAVAAGLIVARREIAGAYAFTHDLVRETLADAVAAPRRALLHGALGTAQVARGGSVEDVARHFVEAAGAGYAEEAVAWATRAGERALAQWAYDAAAASFERALGALELAGPEDRERRRCDLLLALGDAIARAGDAARAAAVVRDAAACARAIGSAERLARAALLLPQGRGEFTTSAQLFDPATAALLEEARHALGAQESGLRSRVLAALSASPGRAALAAEAVALARRVGDPVTLGYALHGYLLTLGPLRAPERLALSEEILALAARANDKLLEFEGRTERLMALIEHGDRAAIDDAVASHARLVAELRQPGPRWTNAVVRALQAFLDGALEESERRAAEALTLGQDAQRETADQAFAGQMGLIRGEQNRLDEIVPAVAALAAAQPDVPAWRCALAFAYAETGRESEARAELDRLAVRGFADLPADGLLHVALANLAEACVALDARAYADALYARLLPLAGRHLVVGGALCLGAADRHLAQLAALRGCTGDAGAHFEAALAAQARLGAIPWLAHTRLEYACLLARTGASRARIEALADEVRRAAATHGLVRVARRLDESGLARGRPTPGAHAHPPARLVREGEYWTVAWGTRVGRLRDLKGLRYLAYLLAHPGRDVHVLDLLALTEGGAVGSRAVATGGELEALDGRARETYRARLAELRIAAEEAARRREIARAAELAAEIGRLEEALAAAYGFAGRAVLRRDARSTGERARKSVANRLRAAVAKLRAVHPDLGRHLTIAVRTGTLCVYRPDRDPRWEVVP